jgi:glycogen debranching enzyme
MADLDTREWLLTNGLGSFASGTVSDVRTRTYHGWLFAATNPPSGRTLLISHLEASLEVLGQVVALGTNFWGNRQIEPTGCELLRCFDINPVPKWIWGKDNWQLSRQLVMPHGLVGTMDWEKSFPIPNTSLREAAPTTSLRDATRTLSTSAQCSIPHTPAQFCHRILIQYRYEGIDAAILRLRLLIADRDFHHQQTANPELQFSQRLGQQQVCLQAINSGHFGTTWHLRWTQGNYQPDAVWYWNYGLPEETQRGLSDREDLYSPGYLSVTLQPGDTVTLEARVGFPELLPDILTPEAFAEAVEAEQERLSQIFGWGEGGKQEEGEKGGKGEGEKERFKITPPLSHSPTP